jgi:hypothetical protein
MTEATFLHRRSWQAQSLLLLGILALVTSCARQPSPQSYFPEVGREAVYQRSLDLRNDLNVLSIALEPGHEDLAALAYFRLARGATTTSAYVTNGEAGESDLRAEYPPYLAAIRREEAARALSYLDGEVYFLNLPAVAAARDSARVRESWPSDSLQTRLTDLLLKVKPDIILVARDWAATEASLRQEVLVSDLLAVVRHLTPTDEPVRRSPTDSGSKWRVDRVFVDNGIRPGISAPTNELHPRWKKSYHDIGEEAARAYASLTLQRPRWTAAEEPSYQLIYPNSTPDLATLDAGLPVPSPPRLRWITEQIDDLTAATLRGETAGALKKVMVVLDSVMVRLGQRYRLGPQEVRRLLHWKRSLENLRCSLLGVTVDYTLSDTALTAAQLTYLTINRVEGIRGEGDTWIFFGGPDQGWVVNEGFEKRLPLQLGERYRLLSPRQVDYNFPHALYGLQASDLAANLMFFIIHRAENREQSFIYRKAVRISFAPKFVSEVLTPLVRMIPGERIVVRLTNFSRDGVADTIRVDDSLATSTASAFRLNQKEATHLDTLFLTWKGNPEDGSYLIPVDIHGITVARFAARKFAAEVDSSKKIGVIPGFANSPIFDALRRLGLRFTKVEIGPKLPQQIDALDVLIVDRRALMLHPDLIQQKTAIDQFVTKGGHLIVLAQDATSWNAQPLWAGIQLTPTQRFDAEIPLLLDSSHSFLSYPNRITADDWNDWLFRRSYNLLSGEMIESASAPVRAELGGEPLLLTIRDGQGRRTYVDLALTPQLMNIHAGAFRLLANLISYSEKDHEKVALSVDRRSARSH